MHDEQPGQPDHYRQRHLFAATEPHGRVRHEENHARGLCARHRRKRPRPMTRQAESSLAKTMLGLAWPSLLLAVLQASLAIVDANLASRLGLDYLAAIAVMYPFFTLMQIVALGGFGGAVAAHVARAAGARDASLVRRTAAVAIGLSFAIGLACSLAYFAFGERLIYRLLKTPASAQLALEYGFLLIGMAPVLWVSNCAVSIARGLGLMKQTLWSACIVYPLQVLGISACIVLLGVQSIWALALATLMGNLCLGLLIAAQAMRHPMLKAACDARVSQWRQILASLSSVGFFTSASSTITGLSLIMLSGIAAARYDQNALSAYGIVMRIEVIMMMLMSSVGVAVVTTCASAMGRKDAATATRAAKIGVTTTAVLVGTLGILCASNAELILRPFSIPPAVHAYAESYLSVVGWTFPLMAVGFSSLFVGQGLHRPRLFFAAAVTRFVFLLGATQVAAQDFGSFAAVVGAGYALFGVLAASGLLYEKSRLRTVFTGQVAFQRKA
ncbi:hypothetical protein D5047_08020 [Verminephrobacter eiseniae]|nr:hypothetical protein [Verminephrobacter eiseniae]